MAELEAARYRRDRDELHALYREGGLGVLTRWIQRVIREAPHPDVRRVALVDEVTVVITTHSGAVATIAVDPAEPCAWCDGRGVAQVPKLHRPPCGGCLGTGLAGRQRGTAGAPTGASGEPEEAGQLAEGTAGA